MRLSEVTKKPEQTVYVDMDGVLVDTYNTIADMVGVDHYNSITPAQWEDFYSKLDGYTFFRDLPMYATAGRLLEIAKQFNGRFSILSSPLNYDVAGSTQGKKEWLRSHGIQPDTAVFDDAKERYATTNGVPNILIDDSPSQLRKWKAAGGIAIPYQADKDNVEDVLDALMVNKDMKISDILEARDTSKRNKMLFFRQTIDSLLDKIAGKTIVVFDTETTGFSVLQPWIQVTEIAAVAIDADTGQEISRFHRKVKLKPETKAEIATQKRNQKSPSEPGANDGDRGAIEGPKGLAIPDLFKMTKYGEKNAPFEDIKKVYQDWADWLNTLDKPVMLGQNAAFDMAHMFAPMKKLGIERPAIGEVLDTMVFARTWIYPLLSAAAEAGDEDAKKMVAGFTNPKTGKLTFSLGPLGKALGVKGNHWHSGISDAMQTYGIFRKMIDIMKQSKEAGYDRSDTFKDLHSQMSHKAFSYGKRPAFQATVKSDTEKGIKARGYPRKEE